MDPVLPGLPINRIAGVVIGIVIDNKDPEGQFRVKLKFPWVRESSSEFSNATDDRDFPSPWARIATMMAGKQMGAFWLPEVGDEVLVAFEHGDLRRPYVIGSLWSPVDKPPHDNGDGKNNYRTFFSRSGCVLQFVDEDGKSRIVLQTGVGADDAAKGHADRGGHFIVLDQTSGAERIEIYDGKQENHVLIDSTNNLIEIKSKQGGIKLSAPSGKIELECQELVTKSSTNTTIQADASMKLKASASTEVTASGTMTIKGSVVKIN